MNENYGSGIYFLLLAGVGSFPGFPKKKFLNKQGKQKEIQNKLKLKTSDKTLNTPID